jgi:cytochrome c biogenesis protein CcmG/thiol:disulfide interchange protein DsbE
MKNKFLPFSIFIIFIIIFIILYKGLQETNIYIPESKSNYEVPSSMVKLFDTNQTVNTIEIFQSDKIIFIKYLVLLVCSLQRRTSIFNGIKKKQTIKSCWYEL